jgi:hypothetical protein
LLAKTDIENAFRLMPITPADHPLLGFTWQGQYYFDKNLPFGCSSSCNLFETFSTAIHWILEKKFQAEVVHIIDDFLFVGPPAHPKCGQDLKAFLFIASDAGIPVKEEKTIMPTCTIEFMGLILDSERMEARLPIDKFALTAG